MDELGSQYAASAAPSLSRQAAQPPPLTRSDLPSPAATRAPPSSQPIHSFQIGARQRNIGNPSPRSIPISATQISSSSSSRPPGGRLNPDRPRAKVITYNVYPIIVNANLNNTPKLPFVQQPAEEIQQQKLSQPVGASPYLTAAFNLITITFRLRGKRLKRSSLTVTQILTSRAHLLLEYFER